ncbi:sialate O-acetylesterase [Mariniblastus fucicola]|nr:sialate O-acetylesterase [Mariniblastus fucicola]
MRPITANNILRIRFLFTRLFLLLVAASAIAGNVSADITLPQLFSDHMVLQRQSSVPVWGTATPNEKLMISFGESEYKVTANAGGRWSTMIRTGGAGGPFELGVSSEDSDLKVGFTNVMVGDVWICAGQSNMEWPVNKALNPETEIEKAKNFSNVRLFSIETSSSPTPLEDFGVVTPWSVCGPDSVKEFSAVGYFFGRELSRKLDDVPIGLIDSTWGGTRCEAWTSRESLDEVESLAPLLKHWDEQKELVTSRNHPANIYNAMVAPMTRFPVRGFIWYQGEANVGRGHQYGTLFPTLISDWRKQFGSEELPFYFVQLAPYKYEGRGENALQELWDAQLKTAKTVPGTGMVVTTDVGNLEDIHPRNKQTVGQRLALLAFGDCYAEELKDNPVEGETCGPLFESISKSGAQVRVTFKHAGESLRLRGQDTTLKGFSVCGEDRVFHPAVATIVDDVVVDLICSKVPDPVEVRYGWNAEFEMNLTNDSGLPASPFRSDDFPLASEGKNF